MIVNNGSYFAWKWDKLAAKKTKEEEDKKKKAIKAKAKENSKSNVSKQEAAAGRGMGEPETCRETGGATERKGINGEKPREGRGMGIPTGGRGMGEPETCRETGGATERKGINGEKPREGLGRGMGYMNYANPQSYGGDYVSGIQAFAQGPEGNVFFKDGHNNVAVLSPYTGQFSALSGHTPESIIERLVAYHNQGMGADQPVQDVAASYYGYNPYLDKTAGVAGAIGGGLRGAATLGLGGGLYGGITGAIRDDIGFWQGAGRGAMVGGAIGGLGGGVLGARGLRNLKLDPRMETMLNDNPVAKEALELTPLMNMMRFNHALSPYMRAAAIGGVAAATPLGDGRFYDSLGSSNQYNPYVDKVAMGSGMPGNGGVTTDYSTTDLQNMGWANSPDLQTEDTLAACGKKTKKASYVFPESSVLQFKADADSKKKV
jgi:hypothetical protein